MTVGVGQLVALQGPLLPDIAGCATQIFLRLTI
jgi:hypothetical protein